MRTALAETVEYRLDLDPVLEMHTLVGQEVALTFTGEIFCLDCGKATKKTYGDGACYVCFSSQPHHSECIIRPELCEAHLGKGRDPDWEEAHHNQPHVVYLARSSAVKVGVTRSTQVPTRWIDQGADSAVVLARTPYRQLAGRIEVALKALYTDRTSWQRMLKGELALADLPSECRRAGAALADEPELAALVTPEEEVLEIPYPIRTTPSKVKSVNLAKAPMLHGTLEGIRGQYLIFGDGRVLNIRRHSAHVVNIEV